MKELLRSAVVVSAALVVGAGCVTRSTYNHDLAVERARAEEKKVTFDNKDSIAGWTVSGDVAVDASKTRPGGAGGSLKIGPGGKAFWKLSDADLSGKVEFWVYEDGKAPADPKAHAYGSLWGRHDGGRSCPGQRIDLCSVSGRRHGPIRWASSIRPRRATSPR